MATVVIRSLSKKDTAEVRCCLVLWLVLALLAIVPPLVLLLAAQVAITTGKGDQRILEKVRPYPQENNLPHFCKAFQVVPYSGTLEGTDIMVRATALNERPVYAKSFSTYAFTEEIQLHHNNSRYLSYYLPSASSVSITSCGSTISGDGVAFSMPVFYDYSDYYTWKNEVDANEPSPCTSCVFEFANFSACPNLSTFHFNTSGYPNKRWYFALNPNYERTTGGLSCNLDLEFTKYLLDTNGVVSNCTLTAGSPCTLSAPSGNQAYVMLEHLVSSVYAYPIKTYLKCAKRDQVSYVLYFFVLPVSLVIGIVFIHWCLMVLGCVDIESDLPTDNATLVSYRSTRDDESLELNGDGFNLHHTRIPSLVLPSYEFSSEYPSPNSPNNYTTTRHTSMAHGRDQNVLSQPGEISETYDLPSYEAVMSRTTRNVDQRRNTPSSTIPAESDDSSDLPVQPPPQYDAAISM